MASKGMILAQSTALGVFTGSSQFWSGGRAALIINAAQYGASVQLQIQQVVNSSVWIPLNAATITADSVVEYTGPAGQYRMNSTGSSAGLTATLVEVPYT